MHDSILTAIEREIVADDPVQNSPIPRPRAVSFSTDRSMVFCPWCNEIVELFNALEAADRFNTDLQDIRFLLNSGEVHALREDSAAIAICGRSLEACFEIRRTRLLDSHFELTMQNCLRGTNE